MREQIAMGGKRIAGIRESVKISGRGETPKILLKLHFPLKSNFVYHHSAISPKHWGNNLESRFFAGVEG